MHNMNTNHNAESKSVDRKQAHKEKKGVNVSEDEHKGTVNQESSGEKRSVNIAEIRERMRN